MSSDPPPAAFLIATVLWGDDPPEPSDPEWVQVFDLARQVEDALADAGLLTPTGGETRTEWGVWYPTDTDDEPRWQFGHTPDAETAAHQHTSDGYGERHGAYVVSRTVHEGPWQPAPTHQPTNPTQET